MAPHPRPLADRFWLKVARSGPDECWEWLGARTAAGYGRIAGEYPARSPRVENAHRVSYRLAYGEIPAGLHIDHLCRNRGCVNPAHMEAVTQAVNSLRGVGKTAQQARRTHCPRGHALAGENLYAWRNHRDCRTCRNRRRSELRDAAYSLAAHD